MTNHSGSGWSLDTLAKFLTFKVEAVDSRITHQIEALKETINLSMAASEKAIQKAELAMDKRMEGANEIRAAMLDQQKNFADKEKTDFRLHALEKYIDTTGGKSQGIGFSVAVIVGVITASASIATVVTAIMGFVLTRH